jgi:hypothetical protein
MTPAAPERRDWRTGLLLAVTLGGVLVAMVVPPIHQDLAYHDFADRRVVLGVPNGVNVLSNLGFLLAGAWAWRRARRAVLPAWELTAALVFALGLVLTGLGSAWYHARPSNATLVWDRLPLSALFPIVFSVAIADRVSVAAGRTLLAPLGLAAVASVVWWHVTDDLRPYAVAQFLPMLLIPLMLLLFPGRRPTRLLLVGVAIYGAGKLAELADGAMFALGGIVSGHTLKHLLAALAATLIMTWLVPLSGNAR